MVLTRASAQITDHLHLEVSLIDYVHVYNYTKYRPVARCLEYRKSRAIFLHGNIPKRYIVEPLNADTPELRTPLKSGQLLGSQWCRSKGVPL